jgi:hypothetical protein
MKLKFKGPKNYAKGALIVEEHAHELWRAGEEKEVDNGKGSYLIHTFAGMFEEIVEKAVKAPQNKMVDTQDLKAK